MESLAAAVATIFVAMILIAFVNLLIVVLARRGKIKFWIGIVSNTITGIAAIIGINGTWVLGLAPLLSIVAGSIILTWPKKSQ